MRLPLPFDLQIRVFFRDHWLCNWCQRPTVFPPAMKYLNRFVEASNYSYPTAFYDHRWRRDSSPILDELAAVIDHRIAYARGGNHTEDNFVTSCNKCNQRKRDKEYREFVEKEKFRRVKGRYGEPENWDGFVSLFMILSEKSELTPHDKKWLKALQNYFVNRYGRQ